MGLSAEWREGEVVVGVDQRLYSAFIRRIGVVDLVAVSEEDAEALPLAADIPGRAPLDERGLVLVVVLHRSDGLVVGDVEVVVEVTAKGRVPRNRPAHSCPERQELAQWGAGDECDRRVESVQVLLVA